MNTLYDCILKFIILINIIYGTIYIQNIFMLNIYFYNMKRIYKWLYGIILNIKFYN